TIVGVTSIAFQTVPLIWSTTFDRLGSLQVTVACFITTPPKLAELNWSGIEPVLPGSTFLTQVPAVVQPHPGRTSLISRVAVPMLVKTNECVTTSPVLTLPKSYTISANSIRGPELSVFARGAADSVWARLEAALPIAPAASTNVRIVLFIKLE